MKLLSINIGQAQQQQRKNFVETTGIYKIPVQEAVEITKLGIAKDVIFDKKNHGGPDQAVYIYTATDYAWWEKEIGKEILPGTFGENLTISDLQSADLNVGDFIHIGDVTLQVTAPRIPCKTFSTRMQDPFWVKKFRNAERPGFYCRVIREGILKIGDEVSVETYQGATISILQMYRDFYKKERTQAELRQHLNAPISIRARVALEKELKTLV